MAVKIIKNTMVEPIEKECEYCKSVFSYNYQDIETKTSYGIFGFEYRDRFVQCPVCKRCLYLQKVKVADGLKESQVFIDEGEGNERDK